MAAHSDDSEGSGDDIRPHGDPRAGDSSEEEESDEEETRKVTAGFIVDDEDLEPEERRKRRKDGSKKRKRPESARSDQDELDDDDLELLAENTGVPNRSKTAAQSQKLKRIRRRGASEEEDDEDDDELDDRRTDRHRNGARDDDDLGIFGDEPTSARRGGDIDELDEDDMDDFIEEDDEDLDNDQMTDAERRASALAKKAQRKAAARKHRNFAGAGLETRQELEDVFGDGGEYAAALSADTRGVRGRSGKARIEDIFEPTEIADKFLTKEDQIVRETDIPERYQFASSTLSLNPVRKDLSEEFPPLEDATSWVAPRVGTRTLQEFFLNDTFKYGFLSAVRETLDAIFNRNLEVPFIWHYRRDTLRLLAEDGSRKIFLHRDELWTVYDLGLKYKAIYQRREHVSKLYESMKDLDPSFSDIYLENHVLSMPDGSAIQSIEAANEALAWLEMRYPVLAERAKELETTRAERKRAGGVGRKLLRKGRIADLLPHFGIDPARVVEKYILGNTDGLESKNSELKPYELAEQYTDAMEGMPEAADVLKIAIEIMAQELGRNPVMLNKVKEIFREHAILNCSPTEKGKAKIDEFHRYYRYKYLRGLPIPALNLNAWYTQMHAAEQDGLLRVEIALSATDLEALEDTLGRCWESPESEPNPEEWNMLRHEIVQKAVNSILVPAATSWLRDDLKQRAEDIVSERCQKELENRVNVRPFNTPSMHQGSSPSVISLSFGRGGKHAIMAICLDDTGRTTSHTKFNNLMDEDEKKTFWALINDHSPDVVVLGGFSADTRRLYTEVDVALKELANEQMREDQNVDSSTIFPREHEMWAQQMQAKQIPLIFVADDVARIYMNSQRAEQENPGWPAHARYALGLARYVQDPLNEFCALGSDLTTIIFVPDYQPLIGQERLLQVLERALVNVVNGVGLDINQAIRDSYLQKLLPYLSGLGPRKADALIKAITKSGGLLSNRAKLLTENLLGPSIMINVAAFLYIQQGEADEMDYRNAAKDDTELPNPLDQTRIHPLDYELASELCINLLKEDPDDALERNPSFFTVQWFNQEQETRARIINESDCADFARRKQEETNQIKFYTVDLIAAEFDEPFKDNRKEFLVPDEWDVCTMLTGETRDTLGVGCIVTGHVIRSMQDQVIIRLESRVEGEVKKELIDAPADEGGVVDARKLLTRGQAVRGVVTDVRPFDLYIAVSSRQQDVLTAGAARIRNILRPVLHFFDVIEERRDQEVMENRKKRELGAVPRIIDHPAWNVANKSQAEKILTKQNRGDLVIRPSSQGNDHLAVTWKVDEGIYQHLDVTEINKPSQHELGRILRVRDFDASYSDLDDLIVNHVKAIAEKVEALTHHEKYRKEDQIEEYLRQYVSAHAGKSAYAFCLDSSRPGWAKVFFLNKSPKDGGIMQSWPIRIMPGAYKLFDAEVPGMTELCTAFKTQYASRLAEQKRNVGRTPAGGRSVYAPPSIHRSAVQRGAVTPAARFGGATPALARLGGGGTPALARFGATPAGRFTPHVPNLPGGMTPRPMMAAASPYVNAPMMGSQTPYGGYPGMAPGMARPPFPPTGMPYQQMNNYTGGMPPRPPMNQPPPNQGW
ncbi:hypothetical protein QFC21_005158 [Naganishia friedmannii]|uniref:Uncharacterized protein n=1 Tax=Naganishia friedmannii TaxID=89922 RepID=A0ACC2VAF1_9TREE|nr:hypothetical protein QFC21_005158 [Naganishia friedmannii]